MGLKNLPICKYIYICIYLSETFAHKYEKKHVLELWLLLNNQFLCRVHKMYRNNNQIQVATPYNRVIETLVVVKATTNSDRGSRWLRGGTERNLQETVCSIELFYHNKKLAQRLDDLKKEKGFSDSPMSTFWNIIFCKGLLFTKFIQIKGNPNHDFNVNSVMMRLEFATRDFQHVLLSHFIDQNLGKYRCPELVDPRVLWSEGLQSRILPAW